DDEQRKGEPRPPAAQEEGREQGGKAREAEERGGPAVGEPGRQGGEGRGAHGAGPCRGPGAAGQIQGYQERAAEATSSWQPLQNRIRCTRWFSVSSTWTRPWRSTARPQGQCSRPGSRAGPPQVPSGSPSAVNFWTRWLSNSATYRAPSGPKA